MKGRGGEERGGQSSGEEKSLNWKQQDFYTEELQELTYTFLSASYFFRDRYSRQNNGSRDVCVSILGNFRGKRVFDNVVVDMDSRRGEFLGYPSGPNLIT